MKTLILGLSAAFALCSALALAQAPTCEKDLADYQETRNGFWIRRQGRMIFYPDKGPAISEPFGNSATHLEIIRRQVGDERFNQIMSSGSDSESDSGLSSALGEVAMAKEKQETVFDAEKIKAEIETYPAGTDLPQELEDKVLAMLRHMERLATPMAPWLRPKVVNKRVDQLGKSMFDDPIAKDIKKNVKIYKAILVTVHLKGRHQFIFSSGASTIADMTHEELKATLELVVPVSRRKDSIPGYIVIKGWDQSLMSGSLDFVRKSDKSSLFHESFDFTADSEPK